MKKQMIDRLGVLSYGALIWGIVNGGIQRGLSHETLESLPVLLPLIAVNLVGVIAVFYCLASFIRHLYTENRQLRSGAKVLWLLLLLMGNVVTMPIYWYLYVVREHIAEATRA